MFLLFIQICLSAGTTEEDSPSGISEFVMYAGRLTWNDDNNGSCIACNGTCTEENAVKPHSWTALLEFYMSGELQYGDIEMCNEYAMKAAEYGVVGYTWTKDTHSCSLHVLEKDYDISEAMVRYNGFDWIEENPDNTGPLYLVKYPSTKDVGSLKAMCYYGVLIQGPRNISSEVNTVLIGLVVIIMISWNGWMRYTQNSPPESPEIRCTDEVPESNDHVNQEPKETQNMTMIDPKTGQKLIIVV